MAPGFAAALSFGCAAAVVADDDDGHGNGGIALGVGELYSIHNLVDNPSFEEHDSIRRKRSEVFTALPGWTSSFGRLELHDRNSGKINAYDAKTKLELDVQDNSDAIQSMATTPGGRYRLEVFFAPQSKRHRTNTNDVEVRWNGDTLRTLSGDKRYWQRHVFDVGTQDEASILMFRAAGRQDGQGGHLDAISLTQTPYWSGNLIDNGSFEIPAELSNSRHQTFQSIPGWSATEGAIELRRDRHSSLDPYEGRNVLSVDRRYNDALEQLIEVIPGRSYDLELYFAPMRSDSSAVEVWDGDTLIGVVEGSRKIWHRRRFTLLPTESPVRLTLRAGVKQRHGSHHGGHDDDHGHDDDDDDDHDDDDDDDDDDDEGGGSAKHGGLVDNLRLYGACYRSDNLIINHSFESYPKLKKKDRGSFLTIPGWRAALGSIDIHRYAGDRRSLMAAEGHSHIELGGDANRAVAQDLSTEPGVQYLLEFAYSPGVEQVGTDRNDVEVWWDGRLISTLGGDRKGWQQHRLTLEASSDLTELRFFGPRTRRGRGGQIDEVRVLRASVLEPSSTPVTEATIGAAYRYDVTLADADIVTPSFALLSAPSGMNIDAESGRITWAEPVVGEHEIIIEVADGCGTTGLQSFTLTVLGSLNEPPIIISTPITQAELFQLRPLVRIEDENLTTQSVLLNGVPFVSGDAVIDDGSYRLDVEASDAAGNTSQFSLEFVIERNP